MGERGDVVWASVVRGSILEDVVTLAALVGLLNNPLEKLSKIVKGSGEVIHPLNC